MRIKNISSNIKKRINPSKYWMERGLNAGNNLDIHPSVSFGSEPYLIRLGNNVRITKNVQFITHDGGVIVIRNLIEEFKDADLFGTIQVGDNVHIGVNAVIMPGVKIGSNCIIGCGAIVTRDIPCNSVAVGCPARVIETISEYVEKNRDRFIFSKRMKQNEKKDFLLKNLVHNL